MMKQLQQSMFPIKLAVQAEKGFTGSDFLTISHATIRHAASTALSALLPEETTIPPGSIRVSMVKGRPQAASGQPETAFYCIEAQCTEAHAAILKTAITSAGCLTMDWGRSRLLRASLFDSKPAEAQYLLHVSTAPFTPMNAEVCLKLLSSMDITTHWVMQLAYNPEASQPWEDMNHHAAPGVPPPKLDDFSWLGINPTPALHFIALVQHGHDAVRRLQRGMDCQSSPQDINPMDHFRVHASGPPGPTVPGNGADATGSKGGCTACGSRDRSPGNCTQAGGRSTGNCPPA
jgi:hypothetical protein